MRPYHVAIVGSGPSGFFAAASLLKAADSDDQLDVAVDMLEMLPTPWGLVRSGVAPDHPKIKSISKQFENIAEDERFRFFGNVVVGEHISATELAEQYDAVVYAIGAQADRPLNIPGEELAGSVAAVDFVGWYNAHPHFEEMSPDLSGARAVVVGQRQRRARRRAHSGDRTGRARPHRHRRPCAGVAAARVASRK